MALREELEAQGAFLFRWRSFVPLLIFAATIPAIAGFGRSHDDHGPIAWQIACLAVSLFGFAIRIAAVGCAPRGTSGRNTKRQKAAEFNVTGMYSVVRHPLYLGNWFMWTGVSLCYHPGWLTAILGLLFWIYYERIIFAEEEFLRGKFGEPYLAWAAQVPAFVPRPWLWIPPSLPFSMRNALKREYAGFAALILAFAGMDVLALAVAERRLAVDGLWTVLLPLALAAFLGLRFLKKRTRLLHVPGR